MFSKVRRALSVPIGWQGPLGKQLDASLSPDVIFDILKNQRRRATLAYLREHETSNQVTVAELATAVAAHEHDCQPDALTAAQRKRVYVALKQSHLPKLTEAGLIEYDANRGQLRLTDRAALYDVYFEMVTGRGFPWSEYYLGLGAVSSALLSGVWVGAFPFTLLSELVWASGITTTFTVSALVNVLVQRRSNLLRTLSEL